jgi:hypothetical protein
MKNIFILPTDKPSRLLLSKRGNLQFLKDNSSTNSNNHFIGTYQNIYITSDEKIKEGDWVYRPTDNIVLKCTVKMLIAVKHLGLIWNKENEKIILTTDQDLIKDGVQPIDDEFLEWYVKNSSCEYVEIESWETKGEWYLDYKIIIPQEESKQEEICPICDGTGEIVSSTTISRFQTCECKYVPQQEVAKQETLEEEAKQETLEEEVECNMCGGYMYLSSNEEIYICTNSECTRCYEEYEEDEVDSKETLEEAAERLQKDKYGIFISKDADVKGQLVINTARAAFLSGMKEGANWQSKIMYSEEEVLKLLNKFSHRDGIDKEENLTLRWFNEFKKK